MLGYLLGLVVEFGGASGLTIEPLLFIFNKIPYIEVPLL
jgi:hypothetical protein